MVRRFGTDPAPRLVWQDADGTALPDGGLTVDPQPWMTGRQTAAVRLHNSGEAALELTGGRWSGPGAAGMEMVDDLVAVLEPGESRVLHFNWDQMLNDQRALLSVDSNDAAANPAWLAVTVKASPPDPVGELLTNGAVHAMVREPDGALLVGGAFSTAGGTQAGGGQPRANLARFQQDLSLDPAAVANCDGAVRCLAVADDSTILLGGDFAMVNGAARRGLARLLASGGLDTGFDAQLDGAVSGISIGPDGSILLAGDFLEVNGLGSLRVARLDAAGEVETAFERGPDGPVHSLSITNEGNIWFGGAFSEVAGAARGNLQVLNEEEGAASTLTVADGVARWQREGALPEVEQVRMEAWTGSAWVELAAPQRVGGGWEAALGGAESPGAILFLRSN
jgi:hypothetical protein